MIETALGTIKGVKELLDLMSTLNDKHGMVRYAFACSTVGMGIFMFANSYVIYERQDRDLIQVVHTARQTAGMNSFAKWLLDERLRATKTGLERKGSIAVPAPELHRAALKMMSEVRFRMLATSSAKGWWKHDFGDEYQASNVDVAGHKDITRIFLYASGEELAALRPVLEAQKRAGINVFVAPLDVTSPLAEDYVVIDDRFAGRLILSLDRNPVRAEFYFDKEKIDEIQQQIRAIAATARPWPLPAPVLLANPGGS
jgi:hypothetical protein